MSKGYDLPIKEYLRLDLSEMEVGDRIFIPMKLNGSDSFTMMGFNLLGINCNPTPENYVRSTPLEYREKVVGVYEDGVAMNYIDIMSAFVLGSDILDNYVYDEQTEKFTRWDRSTLYHKLQELKQCLPEELQERLIGRMERKLVHFSKLTGDVSELYDTIDIGEIWIPSVTEIYGEPFYSDDDRDMQYKKKYPYFDLNTPLMETKEASDRHFNPRSYWTRSALFLSKDQQYVIDEDGALVIRNRTNGLNTVMCMRIRVGDHTPLEKPI